MKELEKYNHTFQIATPGTAWKVNRKPIVSPHRAFIPSLLSRNHYHVFVKYGYAYSVIFGSADVLFWRDLYERMQLKRIGVVRYNAFNRLIDSFRDSGFAGEYPIPLGRDLEILDGSHRLAVSLALQIWPVIEIYDELSHPYDRKWFAENGFSADELRRIDLLADGLISCRQINFDCMRVGLVWGNALCYWESILQMLKKHNLIAGLWIDLGTIEQAERFVMMSYEDDGMDVDRIRSKSKRLAQMSTIVGLFVINDGDDFEIAKTKSEIRSVFSRKLPDYFFDSIIHFIDSREVSRSLVQDIFFRISSDKHPYSRNKRKGGNEK